MIRVRLFAALRELAGESEIEVAGRSVADVTDRLGERFGERFAAIAEVSSFVVNGERASSDTPIAEGDEVAILPPVSGGGHPSPAERTAAGGCAERRPLPYSPPCGSTESCWS